ncbi:ribonuclease P 40kDa subunit-domain-containing protein [Leucosporidium creatinivorum]|uniref:Ribonuclease P 40kDa subunit-domain-containing protein n=1 Tax=Leucosporidium creatinivorum TaxID=106004 RepID=A0A1Y2G3F8_9BASI|nr:ribonuclease P 40kDa subunit-domain-containing protein [Leucosporidium creatinivorum]
MNAHHKKASYRHSIRRTISHFSADSFTLPLDSETHQQAPSPAAEPGGKQGKPRAAPRFFRAVDRVPFGWQLDATIPSIKGQSSALPVELEQMIAQTGAFYYLPAVNLADLLQPAFLNSFVRQGSLIALSLEDGEGEDVVCIDGRGRLVLSVSKDTYEVLGLPGRASAYGAHRQRFIIEISLVDPAFRAGKPGYERVRSLLRNWPRATNLWEELAGVANPKDSAEGGKTFEMVMTYVNPEGKPTPMNFPSPLSARLCQPILHRQTLSSIRVPKLSSLSDLCSADASTSHHAKRQRTSSGAHGTPTPEWQEQVGELKEWLGLVAVGAKEKLSWGVGGEEEVDEQWGVPREECEEGEATHLSWTGFFHPKLFAPLLDKLLQKGSSLPPTSGPSFLALALTPPPHSPLSHLSAASTPVVGTSKKPNGRKVKRGRGRGEEEEARPSSATGTTSVDGGGWELLWKQDGDTVNWCTWEGQ